MSYGSNKAIYNCTGGAMNEQEVVQDLKRLFFIKKNELKVTDRGDENFNDNDSELLLWHGLFI